MSTTFCLSSNMSRKFIISHGSITYSSTLRVINLNAITFPFSIPKFSRASKINLRDSVKIKDYNSGKNFISCY
jgi:hypothetical protein